MRSAQAEGKTEAGAAQRWLGSLSHALVSQGTRHTANRAGWYLAGHGGAGASTQSS